MKRIWIDPVMAILFSFTLLMNSIMLFNLNSRYAGIKELRALEDRVTTLEHAHIVNANDVKGERAD